MPGFFVACLAAGLRLIVRRPLTVVAWLLAGVFLALLGQAPTFLVPLMAWELRPLAPGLMILNFIWIIVTLTILSAAVFRSILKPDERRTAYLRLSTVEARLLTVVAVYALLHLALRLVEPLEAPLAILIPAIVAVGLAQALIAFQGPAIIDRGRFQIRDAWRLTRQHLGAVLILGVVVGGVSMGGDVAVGRALAHYRNLVEVTETGDPNSLVRLALAYTFFGGAFEFLNFRFVSGAAAEAYRRLRPPEPVAAIFD